MFKVLFVCNGNIHRSAIAKQLLLKFARMLVLEKKILVRSRGLQGFLPGSDPPKFPNLTYYEEQWSACRDTLEQLEISSAIAEHVAKPISAADMEEATHVVAMETSVRDNLLAIFPDQAPKISLFGGPAGEGVPDMFERTDPRENRIVILEIYRGVAGLFTELVRQI